MLVDSHCHLDRVNLKPYGGDFQRLMEETVAAGVEHMLCVSIDLERYSKMRNLVEPYPRVSVSVGVHPNERHRRDPTAEELVAMAADSRNVAIGETGLDYYRSEGDLDWQRARFRTHIRAARECGKPLVIHCREAAPDLIAIMREEHAGDAGGVMHCFVESWEVAEQALDLGFYISLSGIVTFKSATALKEVARRVPRERLLVETDAPWLAPVPKRGKQNEPAYVRHTAAYVAELRNEDFATLAQATSDNFDQLFRR